MGSHDPFGYLKQKLLPKEGPEVKLAIWLLTTKSQESTRFPWVQMTCNILLESSWWRLQLCFKPHFNQRFAHKVMGPQNRKTPNFGSPKRKCHLDVGLVKKHRVYYKGKGGGFPQVLWVLWVWICPWLVLTPKVLQLCINHLVFDFVHVCVSSWCLSLLLIPS
jgi:hypothetical protein